VPKKTQYDQKCESKYPLKGPLEWKFSLFKRLPGEDQPTIFWTNGQKKLKIIRLNS
jgi:hypothetical protein